MIIVVGCTVWCFGKALNCGICVLGQTGLHLEEKIEAAEWDVLEYDFNTAKEAQLQSYSGGLSCLGIRE